MPIQPNLDTKATQARPVVSSYNEWDLLEEVIVGVIDGATVPAWDVALEATMPSQHKQFFQTYAGQSFPADLMAAARAELEEFVHILEAEGVTVRRPEPIDFARPYETPNWQSPGGLYAAMPRDTILVVGDTLIEAPMAWRSRYFEIESYRPLLTEYFRKGAKWIAAPKPQLTADQFNHEYDPTLPVYQANGHTNGIYLGYKQGNGSASYAEQPADRFLNYAIRDFEPTFDAADFMRCGRDIFGQLSHVTNPLGVEWLHRHLGPEYKIHLLDVNDPGAMHIDATFIPLAPGKLLLNPNKMGRLPHLLETWEIKYAPPSCIPDNVPLFMSSKWLSVNLLSLDEERVIVEKNEEPLIALLKQWGFKPILCSFRNFNAFGGSFHCATLDVRRRGTLQSYF